MKEFLLEVTVDVDDDEIDTRDKCIAKERQIRKAIEGIDPSVGIFLVESIQ
jgi:hypothetical protein